MTTTKTEAQAQYDRDYRAGWSAADRGSSAKFNQGGGSDAWNDGYLDRAEGNDRWTRRTRRQAN